MSEQAIRKLKILIVRESFWQSFLSDTYTFFCLFSMLYLNHKILGSSWIIDVVIILCWLLRLFSMGSNKVKVIYTKYSADVIVGAISKAETTDET